MPWARRSANKKACPSLQRVFPSVRPLHDAFRLVFLEEEERRPVFEALAQSLRGLPLR